jgi:hypothetical protein
MQELDSTLRAPLRKVRKLSTIFLFAALTPALFAQKTWVEQGPGPIINGQDVGLTNPKNPVSGAINAIAPVDADTVYVGAVNGGVWKTINATAASPTWTQLTDKHLKALSIRSLAISPLNSMHIFAGTGSSSSYSSAGSPGIGVARSLDGGTNWTVEAASTFTGEKIVSIVPTSAKSVVLAAVHYQNSPNNNFGLFRSTDNAKTFTQLTGDGVSGLPGCGVSNIAGDPTSVHRFYAAAPPDFCFPKQTAGVYKSEDDGATWVGVNSGLVVANSKVILLSVSKADGAVYAMVMNSDRTLGGIFRLKNQGTSWTQMDTPTPTIFPGTQAGDQGAIVAHPTLAGIVFVGGDYHPTTYGGCADFGGNIRRGDASQAAGSQWTDIVCDGANGTAPHADSRAFAFNSAGTILLHGDDGGLFKLTNPDTLSPTWSSFNGDIRPSEIHNIAYDPLSHVLLSGNQDTGNSYQLSAGSLTWTDISSGDGAVVAVDADQTAHPGTSIRYEGYINLKFFNRHTFGSDNVEIGTSSALALNITSGPGSNGTILSDTTTQFTNPYVLNNINPSRMLIGTSSLYESLDKGDNFTNFGTLGAPVSSMSYGSALDTVSYPDAFYVGAGASIYHRVTLGNAPTVLTAYPGGKVVSLVMNPLDYQNVYVLDSTGSVYGSTDEGVTWTNFTFDLATKITQPQTIEIFSPPLGKGNKNDQHLRIIVGGIGDVMHLRPKAGDILWTKVGDGLPKGAFIYDLHYNAACDTLIAGSLGRGAWTLASPFSISAGGTCPPVVASGNTGAQPSIGVAGTEAMRQLSVEPNAIENNPPVANNPSVAAGPKAH